MQNDPLHQLIHSLTKSEKRQIHLLLKRSTGTTSRSLNLFDALCKQPIYDEEALRKKLDGATYLKQLGEAKNYLFHQILDRLQKGLVTSTPEESIQQRIRKGKVLRNKKLYIPARKQWQKALKEAEKQELFPLQVEINQLLKELYIRHLDPRNIDTHIQRFQKAEANAWRLWQEKKELEWISLEAFSLYYRVSQPQTTEEQALYAALLDRPELAPARQLRSRSARIIYLNTLGMIYGALARWSDMLQVREALVALYPPSAIQNPANLRPALAALNNYQLGLIHAGHLQAARQLIPRMAAFPEYAGKHLRGNLHIDWFRMHFSNQLEILIRDGAFKEGAHLGETILPQAQAQLPHVYCFPLQYSVAYCHFAIANYDRALALLMPLLHQDDTRFRLDHFRYAQLLQLLVHVALENFDLLHSLTRSARRYLLKTGGLSETENGLLALLQKLPTPHLKLELTHLAATLEKLPITYHQRILWHSLHLPVWVDSQLRGTTFTEAYQKWILEQGQQSA